MTDPNVSAAAFPQATETTLESPVRTLGDGFEVGYFFRTLSSTSKLNPWYYVTWAQVS